MAKDVALFVTRLTLCSVVFQAGSILDLYANLPPILVMRCHEIALKFYKTGE